MKLSNFLVLSLLLSCGSAQLSYSMTSDMMQPAATDEMAVGESVDVTEEEPTEETETIEEDETMDDEGAED